MDHDAIKPNPTNDTTYVPMDSNALLNPTINPNPVSTHPMVTHFCVRTNRPTQRLSLHVSSIFPLPKSYVDAFNDPNWQNAMNDEYGTPSRYKDRLVANGNTQLSGVDVDETFSPIGTDTAYLLLYVDDIVLTVSSEILLQRIIASLHQEFSMMDLGSLNYFMGITVTRNSLGMSLSQRKYATEILERAHMVGCNPCRNPVDTESKLGDDGDRDPDLTLYKSHAGSLKYLTFTRPDISYAVQQVCLYMHDPREPHFSALKRILRYVCGTLDYGLQLISSSTASLVAYSYADWAGCPTTRRSTSGYQAEYHGVANVVAETCWLRNLLRELHAPLSSTMLVYCDNVNDMYLSSNPVQHQRMKHIEIDIHFVRDLVAVGQVRVLHVPSRYQFANIFTKGLPYALFDKF
ncbi:ribonuclease H-like domain-containing protein [Tanacetum coccineum]